MKKKPEQNVLSYDILHRIFFIVVGCAIILLQGLFTAQEIFAVMFPLIVWLCFNAKKCMHSEVVVPCFIICFLLFINLWAGKGFFPETTAECVKWMLLIFSFYCFTTPYKNYFAFGILSAVSFSAFIGILAFFKIIPSDYFSTIQLVAEVDGQRQIFSLFGYSNTAAAFFGSAIFICIYFIRQNFLPAVNKWLIPVNLIAFFLTRSNFAYICFVVTLLGLFAHSRKKFRLFLVLCGLTVTAAFIIAITIHVIPGSTVIIRLIYASDALKAFKSFGLGYGVWTDMKYSVQTAIYPTDFLHNGFLQLMLEGGLHILIIFICFIGLTLIKLIKNKNNDNAVLIALFGFLLLHSLTDVDMAYGGLYVLFGFIASFVAETDNRFSFKRPVFIISGTITLLLCVLYFNALLSPPSEEYYLKKAEENKLTASEAKYLYEGAAEVYDAESMYYFSLQWLELAPKSQEAYNAVYNSINKVYNATLDENYLKVSMPALYNKMKQENASMNPLCRYLDKNAYIELP